MLDTKLDTNTFKQTAQAVFILNESASERYANWQNLQGFMESMAHQYCIDRSETFFSTGGFCLTAFNTPTERHVVATVMAYTAKKYLDAFDSATQ